jgi:hypothetical protein
MDSGSDDCRVPPPGEALERRGKGPEDSPVKTEVETPDEDAPCFTERELERLLPPIPDWMRKPPPLRRQPRQPNLFEDERDE